MEMTKIVPSLLVSDIQRSVAFYRGLLGFLMINSYCEAGQLVWCHLKSGGAELMLQQAEGKSPHRMADDHPNWAIYLSPGDIEAMYKELQEAGHKTTSLNETSYGTKEFTTLDPDGYELWVSHPSM